MAGTVEPTAWMGVAPRARIDGVVRTAPPMPNIPASTPEANPRTSVASGDPGEDVVHRVSIAHRRSAPGPHARPVTTGERVVIR